MRDHLDTTRPSRDATQSERDAARDARQAELATALATELDIDEATVTAALTEIQTERDAAEAADEEAALGQAVADGTLSQTEAEAVQKAIDAGIVSIRGAGHGHR